MDSDTKSFLTNIASIVIGGAIIWYLFWKPALQLQQSNQLQLQQQQQIRQQLQQYQQQYQPYYQQQPNLSVPIVAPMVNTGYKNDEKWVIERGTDGHIKSLQIVRDAKVRKIL